MKRKFPFTPDSVRDLTAEKEIIAQEAEYAEEIQDTWRFNKIRVYTVKAIINDVCEFYLDTLDPTDYPLDEPELYNPGDILPPWYEVRYYEPNIFGINIIKMNLYMMAIG